ncbi:MULTISPECIES: SprT-like domain-containing protein [Halomonadaceae]|uniref:SprT family zinc-dependent metalloprotease n=1 Tax=Halomonadaceae TaxID=28256 RepID=UPI001597615A|nr:MULTISPECIES: SprT-like domain-containing protein [Halomonas]QJQ96787.1 metallopeptidase [Halomonas sp. PA5]
MNPPALPTPCDDQLAQLDEAALHLTLHDQVEAAWRRCLEVHPGLPRPRVWLDLRGKSAGQAHYGRGGLRFNPILYRENRHAFLAEVVPHEMAHWLVRHLEEGPRTRPHGREWQTVMRQLFGLEPHVTHRFDVARASPTPYRYRCTCREHFLSARRHGLANRGNRYRCRECAQTLVYMPAQVP